MSTTDGFKEFVLDQLTGLRGLTCRAMFGGYGLRYRDTLFGIIFKGRLYFRVSPATVADYHAQGMKPFTPSPHRTLKAYYEVPLDILEDAEQIIPWANSAAVATPPARKRPSRSARRTASVAGSTGLRPGD